MVRPAVVGSTSPRCPCPNPQNIRIACASWQRIQVTDGIEVTHQPVLRWEDYSGLSGGANVTTGSLNVEEGGRRGSVRVTLLLD
jgi:hypothetical protein